MHSLQIQSMLIRSHEKLLPFQDFPHFKARAFYNSAIWIAKKKIKTV